MTAPIPEGKGLCPCCQGSGRMPAGLEWRWSAGYDHATQTITCRNCGGQTMSGVAQGYTRLDPATGLGCLHVWEGHKAGNCYHVYTCTKCGEWYDIDSGD